MARHTITLLIVVMLFGITSAVAQRVRIAAASDLKFALDSVAKVFEVRQKSKLTITYGSSGKIFEQITNGAPFDIFFSADIVYPQMLQEKGLTGTPIKIYGIGRIVLWQRKDKWLIKDYADLANSAIQKIAIANPRHAPYGRRAEEFLKHNGLHDKVQHKLVLGENISQAAQFAFSGAADAGIIALSLALSPAMRESGDYMLIPEDSHSALNQAYVVLTNSSNKTGVRTFVDFMETAEVKEILSYFGFKTPISQTP